MMFDQCLRKADPKIHACEESILCYSFCSVAILLLYNLWRCFSIRLYRPGISRRGRAGNTSLYVCWKNLKQVFWWSRDNVVCTCKFKTRLWLWENKEARSSGREALLTGSSSAVALAAVDGRTSGAPQGTRIQLALNWFKNTYLLHLWQCFEVTSESLRDNSFDYQHWKDKWFLWQIKTVQNQRSRGKIYR